MAYIFFRNKRFKTLMVMTEHDNNENKKQEILQEKGKSTVMKTGAQRDEQLDEEIRGQLRKKSLENRELNGKR